MSAPEVKISEPSSEDFVAMFEVRTAASVATYASDEVTEQDIVEDMEKSRSIIIDALESDKFNSRCAKVGGVVVGMCVWDSSSFPRKLNWLYIDPEYQGQGIGANLLRIVLEQIGNQPIELETAQASEFYEREGFKTYGSQVWLVNGKSIPEKLMIKEPQE